MTAKPLFLILAMLAAIPLFAAEPSATASINVSSEPDGAQVYLNHELRGTSPMSIDALNAGTYLVTLSKPGFEDYHKTVDLNDGIRFPVQAELEAVRGLLLVHSVPSGAEVSIDGASFGATPLLVTTLRLGVHRVRLSATGFQPKEVEVELSDRAPRKISLDLASDSGTLEVTSIPPGAEVLLDGIPRGPAPCTVDRITVGDHELAVQLDGYVEARQTIRLAAGETQAMRVSLEPKPASLQIVSIPDGARVYVDNQFQGVTPHSLIDIKPGEYRVRVEKDGHDPLVRTVMLGRGDRKVEEFRLSSNTGRLELTTEPADVTVLVNGRKVGVTSAKDGETTNVSALFPVEALPAGECELRFVRKGFFEKTQKAVITRGETATLHVALKRRFIPDFEITTANGTYKGVYDSKTEDGIRLETAPGLFQNFADKDILTRKILRDE